MKITFNKLGLGMMRLPEENGEVDIDKVIEMVDSCMADGYRYFDTAYNYHNGLSEGVLKEALVNRYPRDTFYVADKLPGWLLKEQVDVDKIFKTQLERTGLAYFDYYLLHTVTANLLKSYDEFDCWQWGQSMKEQGYIKKFGFSFHDSPRLLDKILSEHPEVDFVQLQLNYADWHDKKVASKACYDVARKYDVPIIVMEPVKGGLLANLHPALEEQLKAFNQDYSVVSWALRFTASLEGVFLTLSGMSNSSQVQENLALFNAFNPLSEDEVEMVMKISEQISKTDTIACTNCKYCVKDCPMEIEIPNLIKIYNEDLSFGSHDVAKQKYKSETKGKAKASYCIGCNKCEKICPQHLSVVSIMDNIAKNYEY